MKSFIVILCFWALVVCGCGNDEKNTEADSGKSSSEKLGENIGDSIEDIKQKAQDAADAGQKSWDEIRKSAEENGTQ